MSQADDEIRASLDQGQSFLLDAGAGAGKTYSLVVALRHLLSTKGDELLRRGQHIGCITFTKVAAAEIIERTEDNPAIWVSTIHAFLWEVMKNHQKPLKAAVVKFNSSLPLDSSRRRDEVKLQEVLPAVHVTYSETGSNFLEGRLFHDDVIGVAKIMFEDNRLLGRIVAARFPIIFVDEYQDTSPVVVEILLERVLSCSTVIGLFGDKMQSIYEGSVGELSDSFRQKLQVIPKGENRRCSKAVIDVLNHIRTDIKQFPAGANAEGLALYINARSQADADPIGMAQAAAQRRPGWEANTVEVRELYLTHKLIAGKGGYRALLDVFERRGGFYREQLLNGEDRRIGFFIDRVEPLAEAWSRGTVGVALSALRDAGLRILSIEDKRRVRDALNRLMILRAEGTVGQVLSHIRDKKLIPLLDDFVERLASDPTAPLDPALDQEARDREERARTFYSSLFELPYAQVASFVLFFKKHTPFATKHGVKGAEFENVFVVLDDSGARWNMYSFDKYLSGADATEKQDRYRRTRNIFYVCCSRAKKGLVVVDLGARSAAKDQAVQSMFGTDNCIYL